MIEFEVQLKLLEENDARIRRIPAVSPCLLLGECEFADGEWGLGMQDKDFQNKTRLSDPGCQMGDVERISVTILTDPIRHFRKCAIAASIDGPDGYRQWNGAFRIGGDSVILLEELEPHDAERPLRLVAQADGRYKRFIGDRPVSFRDVRSFAFLFAD